VTERFSTTVDGVELSAEKTESGWRVTFGSKVVEGRFIDHVVAEAVGVLPAEALKLLRRLFPPPL